MGGYFLEYPNFEIANSLKTPDHIAPVWYFTPYYSVLRAIPDKFLGFVAFAAAVAIPFMLPWLDRSPVKSWRYKGNFTKVALILFSASFLILGVLGVKNPTPERTFLAQICSVIYFAFFLGMPIWTSMEKTKPIPERVTMNGGIGIWGSLAALVLVALLTMLPLKAVGAESAFNCGAVACDHVDNDVSDSGSLQRGAQLYMNYCMGCHGLKYARYERAANDMGIPDDLFEENLKFDSSAKIGDLMYSSMSEKQGKQWFGAAPPDLTLIARSRAKAGTRGTEWLYTYLRNFYQDESRPYGVNNRVFPDVGMPHALLELQGMQKCVMGSSNGADAKLDPLSGDEMMDSPCGSYELVTEGSMTPQEFDVAMTDLVNFLDYMAEPMQLQRERTGIYVLLYLALFFVFAYLLNREYWKGIH
jgi:ubiquinol-cytochrome c reductase cytochrome b subunit